MAKVDGTIPWLVDEVTEAVVGYKRKNGSEVYIPRIFQNHRTLGFIGDSMTAVSGPVTSSPYISYQDRGFWVWANQFLGQYFEVVASAGITGNKTSDMLGRLDSDVLAYSPAWVGVLGGYNDIVNNVPWQITVANLAAIYQKIIATGTKVIALTVLPSSTISAGAQTEALYQVNRWIRWYSSRTPGIVLVDAFSALIDPTSSTNAAITGALQADNIHPKSYGGYLVGQLIANTIRYLIPPVSFCTSLSDQISATFPQGNCIVNPIQQGAGGNLQTGVSGAVSSNWNGMCSGSVTATGSKVARTDFPNLTWQQYAASFTGAGTLYHYTPNISLPAAMPVGTVVSAEVEINIASNTLAGASSGVSVNLIANGGSGVNTSIGSSCVDGVAATGSMVIKTPPMAIPAGTTSLAVQVTAVSASTGAITFSVGRATCCAAYPSVLTA